MLIILFVFQAMQLSRNLDSLLCAMCEEDPSLRMALVHVLEVTIYIMSY